MHSFNGENASYPKPSQAESIMYNEKKPLNKTEINVLPILSES